MLTEDEKMAWGKREFQDRLSDLADMHAGKMTLEEVQKRARQRQRRSGMTDHVSYHYMNSAAKEMRAAR